MPEADPAFGRPPGGPSPPAPPATGEPGGQPDPRDPGPPIPVRLGILQLGDLGHPRVDSRLLTAVLLRNGRVADWLRSRGIDVDDVRSAFPDADW